MIAIIDYGMGNIHSVKKALEYLGAKTVVTNNPKDLARCDRAVLPGVGAFDDAILELKQQNLIPALNDFLKRGGIFLGICLGMQILFESSQEAKRTKGLCIFRGEVKRFAEKNKIKVPHTGWNRLKKTPADCPLLKDISDDAYVYFCHSYYPKPDDESIIGATTDYGIDFASVVFRKNVYGVQFHPEKSQAVGLKLLKNFVDLC